MFCSDLNDPDETRPNFNVCPVCMAHPGTLPVINEEAIKKLISVGLALNCQISQFSKFDRKNYFYPDLPKGYQISQFDLPVCREGWLEVRGGRRIRIERIHMEEDTGRLQHAADGRYSLVDYNRAGIPLMELVTKPDLVSGEEIELFARELQLILRYLGTSDANMEKGQMRVEVNISVKRIGEDKLGTKVEVKNINSINAASRAADFETKRQSQALEAGDKIVQETRGWDDARQKTFSQRVKEGSADYRYFPEPDLPPLRFSEEYINDIRGRLPELPSQKRIRFEGEYGLTRAQADLFAFHPRLAGYFENVASEILSWDGYEHLKHPGKEHEKALLTLAANYAITEFPPAFESLKLGMDEIDNLKMTPENFGELIVRVFHKELSSTAAKSVLKEMMISGGDPDEVMKRLDLGQVSDADTLIAIVEQVIAQNPKTIEDYRKGKTEALKFLVGRAMGATKGKGNPEVIMELLKQKLLVDIRS